MSRYKYVTFFFDENSLVPEGEFEADFVLYAKDGRQIVFPKQRGIVHEDGSPTSREGGRGLCVCETALVGRDGICQKCGLVHISPRRLR